LRLLNVNGKFLIHNDVSLIVTAGGKQKSIITKT